jgi:hypothetical protein
VTVEYGKTWQMDVVPVVLSVAAIMGAVAFVAI